MRGKAKTVLSSDFHAPILTLVKLSARAITLLEALEGTQKSQQVMLRSPRQATLWSLWAYSSQAPISDAMTKCRLVSEGGLRLFTCRWNLVDEDSLKPL